MPEINALLSYSVLLETESIIENKYAIAKEYIEVCKSKNIKFIDPVADNQRSNLYKFILLAESEEEQKILNQITNRTSSVYDYALGSDENSISNKHICLPIWYGQEEEFTKKVIDQILSITS